MLLLLIENVNRMTRVPSSRVWRELGCVGVWYCCNHKDVPYENGSWGHPHEFAAARSKTRRLQTAKAPPQSVTSTATTDHRAVTSKCADGRTDTY